MTIPVILSGGSGSRLWPLSRQDYPKKFLPLIANQSLLQETILRSQKTENCNAKTWLIGHTDHQFILQN